jgi:hypothetical protein
MLRFWRRLSVQIEVLWDVVASWSLVAKHGDFGGTWRQNMPPKRRYPPTKLPDATTHNLNRCWKVLSCGVRRHVNRQSQPAFRTSTFLRKQRLPPASRWFLEHLKSYTSQCWTYTFQNVCKAKQFWGVHPLLAPLKLWDFQQKSTGHKRVHQFSLQLLQGQAAA